MLNLATGLVRYAIRPAPCDPCFGELAQPAVNSMPRTDTDNAARDERLINMRIPCTLGAVRGCLLVQRRLKAKALSHRESDGTPRNERAELQTTLSSNSARKGGRESKRRGMFRKRRRNAGCRLIATHDYGMCGQTRECEQPLLCERSDDPRSQIGRCAWCKHSCQSDTIVPVHSACLRGRLHNIRNRSSNSIPSPEPSPARCKR